jgi:hypothetical protein
MCSALCAEKLKPLKYSEKLRGGGLLTVFLNLIQGV